MRVWAIDEKRHADSDDARWVCEWCTDPSGVLDDDLHDLADLVYERAGFGARGKGLAIAHAKRILRDGRDCLGAVQVFRESFEIVEGDAGYFEREDDTLIEITHDDLAPANDAEGGR